MRTFRIMTYNIHCCLGADGLIDPERIAGVIRKGQPDIVALQDVDAASGADQLNRLASLVGLGAYGSATRSGCSGFLSRFPITGLRSFDLGEGGSCLRADLKLGGSRLHLFNVHLDTDPGKRAKQFSALLGEDLLGSPALVCPTIVLGDFAHRLFENLGPRLPHELRKSRRILWQGTYPARFPLSGRDKVYFSGSIRELGTHVDRCGLARSASNHLPLMLSFELADSRCYISLKEAKKSGLEVVAG